MTIIPRLKLALDKNAPHILTAVGAFGVVSTAVLAARAAVPAYKLLQDNPEASTKEKIRLTWKIFTPTAISATLSIAAIVCSDRISATRTTSLATATALANTSLKLYQDKVLEVAGEEVAKQVKEKVAEEKVKNSAPPTSASLVVGDGDVLCYDSHSGRYFHSTVEKIKRAENELNRELLQEMWVSLNQFYDKIGLEGVKMGESLGWSADALIDIMFLGRLSEEGTPCVVIDYSLDPKFDGWRMSA